jgi:putative protease
MRFWASQGLSRVILPRESSLAQIRALSSFGVCETEIFIHGAMCVSISGRCLLGAYLSGRHANRGECPQPCRFQYEVAPKPKKGEQTTEWFPVEEDKDGVYLFNSKDLNTLPILPEIVETGVSALKIEGRNKSLHYVSSVVKTYRAALDRCLENPGNYKPEQSWLEEFENLDHRPYTTGFYTGEYLMQEPAVSKVKSRIRVVGVVKGLLAGGAAVVDVKNPFTAGEKLAVLPVNKKKSPFDIQFTGITDLSGNKLERAVTNRVVVAEGEVKLAVGDVVRRKMREIKI